MLKNLLKEIVILIIILVSLSGCYDEKELDDLAYVIAIGIDKGDKEEELEITFQIAVPIKIAGENAEGSEEASTLLTIKSSSLYTAVSIANSSISKEINLSHIKLIVYSEELAKEGLSGYLNTFVTNKDIRPRTSIVICKDTSAKEFLSSIKPELELNPARYYDLILSSFNYTGYSTGTELIEFYISTQSPSIDPSAVLANINKEESDKPVAKFIGMAAFSGGKMVGELSQDETLAHLILEGDLNVVNIPVKDVTLSDKTSVITLMQKKKPKISVHLENDIPIIDISLLLDAKLAKTISDTDYMKDENKDKLTENTKKHVEDLLNNYLNKTSKELKVDISGFGKYAKINYATWKDFINIEWLSKYQNAVFNLDVSINLDTSQIVSHSLPTIESKGE